MTYIDVLTKHYDLVTFWDVRPLILSSNSAVEGVINYSIFFRNLIFSCTFKVTIYGHRYTHRATRTCMYVQPIRAPCRISTPVTTNPRGQSQERLQLFH